MHMMLFDQHQDISGASNTCGAASHAAANGSSNVLSAEVTRVPNATESCQLTGAGGLRGSSPVCLSTLCVFEEEKRRGTNTTKYLSQKHTIMHALGQAQSAWLPHGFACRCNTKSIRIVNNGRFAVGRKPVAANQGSEQIGPVQQEIKREPERRSLAGSKRRRKADSTDFIASGLTRRFG